MPARILFVPAIAVMNRLSFARKFLLIALLLAGPLATVAWLQSSSATERLLFARKERAGIALLTPTTDLFCALQRHRLLATAVDAGATDLAVARDQSAAEADAALARAGALDRGVLQPAAEQWARARSDRRERIPLTTALLELLLTRIGSETNLILDPDPDSYWLADALVVQIPELAGSVTQAGTAALEGSEHLASDVALARSRSAHLSQVTLRTAFRESAKAGLPDIERGVREPLWHAIRAVDELLAIVEAKAPAREVTTRGAAALDALQHLTAAIAPQLDALLERREHRFQNQRGLGLAASGAAALVLAYLFIAIYLSVRSSVQALEEAAGTPERFLAPSRDELGLIAEAYRRARGEQRVLKEQLRRADRLATVGQLAAGTAHELNEPIAAILGFAQLAQKCQGLPGQAEKDLSRIARAALHAREIIQQLLYFARQTPPRTAATDLNAVVAEGLELVRPRCVQAEVSLERTLAADLPKIEADRGQLRQVVVNLVVNAVQASKPGSAVAISTSALPGSVVLAVQDHGCGMSQEVREHLFLPFYTTKEIGQGTGLGLSVVHGIVTAHGGTIQVESAPERGTRIEVRLPVGAALATPSA